MKPKRGILLFLLLTLISLKSISQTTSDSTICIPKVKAIKIARDLEAYKSLKIQDSLHQVNITNLQTQLSLKDTAISLINQKVTFILQINADLTQKSSLQIDITKHYVTQIKVLKLERAGIVAISVGIILKLLIK